MAWTFTNNQQILETVQLNLLANYWFLLKEALKASGWTHIASGDGDAIFSTTVGNVNDVITHAGTGANGMRNSQAWYVLQQPSGGSAPFSGTRQILVQIGTQVSTQVNQRMAYSFADGFSGGTPGANNAPTQGADTQFLWGGGTSAAPTFTLSTSNAFGVNPYVHIAVGDVDEGFSFVLNGYATGATSASASVQIAYDALEPGSFPYGAGPGLQEPDPIVFRISNSTMMAVGGTVYTWSKKGEGGQAWLANTVIAYGYLSDEVWPVNVWSGKDQALPVVYGRSVALASTPGIKGISRVYKWQTQRRGFLSLLTIDATGDQLCFLDCSVPWNNDVPSP